MSGNNFTKLAAVLAAVGVSVLASSSARADVTFSATGGSLSASAEFQNVGGNLVVTLANTASVATEDPASMLTAVVFTLSGGPSLTASTATAPGGVVEWNGSAWVTVSSPNVGGNWRYQDTLTGAPASGATSGIGSTGLNLFNASGPNGGGNFSASANFTSVNLDGPPWGIVTPNYDQSASALQANSPILIGSAVFTLTGLGTFNPTAGNVLDVEFIYGTADFNGENHLFPPNIVPEPTTFIAGALLLLPFGASTLRILRRKQTA